VKPEPAPLPLLIARLARDGAPVAPLPSPLARWSRWTLKAAAAAAIVTLLLGVRPNLGVQVHEARFVLAAIFTASLALAAAARAFRLSVPGASHSRVARLMPLIAILAWAALLWIRMVAIGSPMTEIAATPPHPVCILLIVAIGVGPGVWLFDMLRRAAPLEARRTAMFAALGAFACGALGTQFICPIDAPGHLLLWHFLPVLALASVGRVFGARLLRWRRATSAGILRDLP
jgi:hypothetical protein